MKLAIHGQRHFQWVESMGWHQKTPKEALSLVVSEIGEAMNECRSDVPSTNFGSELADIILRLLDYSIWMKYDLKKIDSLFEDQNISLFISDLPLETLGNVSVVLSKILSKHNWNSKNEKYISQIIKMIYVLATKYNINLEEEIIQKISKNESKGNYKNRSK